MLLLEKKWLENFHQLGNFKWNYIEGKKQKISKIQSDF